MLILSIRLPIELASYNPEWPLLFEEEVASLRPIFGKNLVDIHHVGSTSIPDLAAKPIIDILPVVHDLGIVDDINPQMEALDYICVGELGIPGRRFFCKSVGLRTHNMHVFQKNDPHVIRHLKFRDILRSRPDLAEEYGRLKSELAEKYHDDRKAYTDAKTEFIRKIEGM